MRWPIPASPRRGSGIELSEQIFPLKDGWVIEIGFPTWARSKIQIPSKTTQFTDSVRPQTTNNLKQVFHELINEVQQTQQTVYSVPAACNFPQSPMKDSTNSQISLIKAASSRFKSERFIDS